MQISGAEVQVPEPPSLLAFIEESVGDGTLLGLTVPLKALVQAGVGLLDSGKPTAACHPLHTASLRVDGEPRPPDFVTGEAVAEVLERINEILAELDCR
jgi:hypothetical protein